MVKGFEAFLCGFIMCIRQKYYFVVMGQHPGDTMWHFKANNWFCNLVQSLDFKYHDVAKRYPALDCGPGFYVSVCERSRSIFDGMRALPWTDPPPARHRPVSEAG